ncbi:MAG: hypothetical protein H7839_22710 [Magnetococcus sp. YQC-5]
MRVALCREVLTEQGFWRDLDRIINRIDRGAHEWEVDDPDGIEESAWLREGRSYLRELFAKASTRGIWGHSNMHKRCVTVTANPDTQNPWALTPPAAANFLDQPLVILLENEFTDTIFLKTVLHVLGPKELLDYCHGVPDAIHCKGVGGIGEIPKHVKKHVQKSRQAGVPLRVIVLADSDGTVPGEVSKNAKKVQDICVTHNIPCCLLKKRAIENYMPDIIFRQWSSEPTQTNVRPRAEALLRLTPAQRDHFNIKKGLSKLPEEKEKQKELYISLAPQDRTILENGFGEVIHLFETYRHILSKQDMSDRVGDEELTQLVHMIIDEV